MRAALAAAPPDDPRARLTALGEAYIRFARNHPHHLRVMFGDFPEACQPDTGDSFNLLVQAITEGQEAGHIVEGNPLQLALMLWSTVHGLSILLIENKIPAVILNTDRLEHLIDHCLQLTYRGLAKR